jgi:hypothetical protein
VAESGELQKDLEKHQEKVEEGGYESLIKQIDAEYSIASGFIKSRWDEWNIRLKLYNNQKRDKTKVGDPLIFAVHQTILASLYEDFMNVSFEPNERGDEETAENLNFLAKYDYQAMEKDITDFEWDWDATFFGRGLLLFQEFDRELKHPIPEVIDPMAFLRDPRACSINGDLKGRGAASFFGREVRLTRNEMRLAGIYSNWEDLKGTDRQTEIDLNRQKRQEAQGYEAIKQRLAGTDNEDFVVNEWFTYWKGEKYLITLAEDRKRVIRVTKLPAGRWPVIDRTIYPLSHTWDAISIPDLVEDKQRARAKMQNLSLESAEAQQYPMYLFDSNKIKNKAALAKFEANKFIESKGNPAGAVQAIERKGVSGDIQWVLGWLDTAAQRATATPELQQGVLSQDKRTATELGQVQQNVDTRYSLSAKIFGWSERRFWQQWYALYKKHFKEEIDEKVLRLAGAMGAEWRSLSRENIIANVDPDVTIESRKISEAKRINKLNAFSAFSAQALSNDPGANKREMVKFFGKLSGLTTDELSRLLPKTFDEYEATRENELLSDNKTAQITMAQDHQTHILIHSKAADTKAKAKHIEMHNVALYVKRERSDMFAPSEVPQNDQKAPSAEGSPTAAENKVSIDMAQQLQTA